jgi:hypothetical protein
MDPHSKDALLTAFVAAIRAGRALASWADTENAAGLAAYARQNGTQVAQVPEAIEKATKAVEAAAASAEQSVERCKADLTRLADAPRPLPGTREESTLKRQAETLNRQIAEHRDIANHLRNVLSQENVEAIVAAARRGRDCVLRVHGEQAVEQACASINRALHELSLDRLLLPVTGALAGYESERQFIRELTGGPPLPRVVVEGLAELQRALEKLGHAVIVPAEDEGEETPEQPLRAAGGQR